VFENRVLRRVFGPKRYEVTKEWRKLHNDEIYDLYSSPNIVRAIKSRRMRWERGEALTGFWWRKLTETDHLEDLSVDGRIMSKCIFKKRDGVHWIELAHYRDR
jgi:uncharacterized protein YcaQ